jgi:hypothetical protein
VRNRPGDGEWQRRWTVVSGHVLWSREGRKRVAGGAVGEVAGGAGAFYRAGGEGAEAVRE